MTQPIPPLILVLTQATTQKPRGRGLTSGEFVVKSNDQDLDTFISVLVLGWAISEHVQIKASLFL